MVSGILKLDFITAAFGGGLAVLSMFAAGCGPVVDSDESFAIASGLPPHKLLSELTREEARSLCKATSAVVLQELSLAREVQIVCTIEASVLATGLWPDGHLHVDQKTCERVRDECTARISVPPNAALPDNCNALLMPGGPAAACRATVDDFERCAGATLHEAALTLAHWDCAYLAKQPVVQGDTATTQTESAPLAQCGDYEAKCGTLGLLGAPPGR